MAGNLDDPLDVLAGDLPALELEDIGPPRHSGRAPRAASALPSRRASGPPPSSAPVARSRGGHQRSDVQDAVRLARHGDAPESALGAITYAVSVWLRRRELRKALIALKRRQAAAEDRLDTLLVDLGRAAHENRARYTGTGLESALRHLQGATADMDAASKELAEADELADVERAQLDREVERAREALGPWQDREVRLTKEVDVLEAERRRLEAALKRAEIEIREGGETDALLAARDARRVEADTQTARVEEKRRALQESQKAVALHAHALQKCEDARRQLEEDIQGSLQRIRDATGLASKSLEEKLGGLGEKALALEETVDLPEAKLARKAVAGLRALERDQARHVRALNVHDHEAYRKGMTIIGIALVAVLAMVVVAAVI